MKYRAFISYRRQDASAAARWLRDKLLGFRPPEELLDRLAPERRVDLERRVAYFLDTSYQSANEDFWTNNIEPALKESEYLIVISSPSALLARDDGSDNWVAREIDTFVKIWGEEEGRRRIILVLASGAPEDRYPGRLNALVERPDWADLRAVSRVAWLRAGAAERLGDALLKIVARIHQVPQELLPILTREEARKRGRLRVAAGAVAAVVLAVLGAALGWAVFERGTAIERRDEAMLREARFLAKAAQAELDRGRHMTALALALEALPRDMARPDRPYAPAAQWMAQASVQDRVRGIVEWSRQDSWIRSHPAGVLLPDGRRLLVGRNDGTLLLVDATDGRTIATLRGHKGEIVGIAPTRDGKRALTWCQDGTARLWDLTAPDQAPAVFEAGAMIVEASLSRDERRLVLIAGGPQLMVFDVASGKRLPDLPNADDAAHAVFSPDGRSLLVRLLSNELHLLHIDTQQDVPIKLPAGSKPGSLAFSHDGTRTLICLEGLAAYLLKPSDGTVAVLESDRQTFNSAQFAPDGKTVLTLGRDGAQLWSVPDGKPLWFAPMRRGAQLATYAPDGGTIFVVHDHAVEMLDARNGEKRQVMGVGGEHNQEIADVVVSTDGRRVLTMSVDRTARLWDAASGASLARLDHDDTVIAGYLSSDLTRIVTATRNGAVKLWHVGGPPFGPLALPAPRDGSDLGFDSAQFTHDGRFLLLHARSGGLYVLSAQTGAPYRAAHQDRVDLLKAAVSADGRRVATANNRYHGGGVAVFSVPDLERVGSLVEPDTREAIDDAALSPDGTLALTRGGANRVRLWDVASGKPRFTVQDPEGVLEGSRGDLSCLAFSRDGKRILVTAQAATVLADAADGRAIKVVKGQHTACAQFSPDSTKVLVAQADESVAILSAVDGAGSGTLIGHAGEVRHLVFAPAGDRVLTVDKDAVRVFAMPGGRLLTTYRGHTDRPTGAAFSPDGRRVLSYARDRTARLWLTDDASRTIGSFQFDEAFELNDTAAFSSTGDRVVVLQSRSVWLWPHLGSTQSVIDAGCATLSQPLSRAQRREFFLDEDPRDPPCSWHPDMKDKPRR